jgi:hypothetical protein
MRFIWQGRQFDTEAMIVVPEPIGGTMGAFITPDYQHVFSVRMLPSKEAEIAHMEVEFLHKIAEESGNPDLIRALEMQTK